MEHAPGQELTLREKREQTVTRLVEHFAQDRLTLEEFERRVDVAQRARDPGELAALLQDLQAHVPAAPPAHQPAPRTAAPPVVRQEHGLVVSIMGGVERRGAWRPAANTFVLALMGGSELDFRDVVLPPGPTEVFILAFMGGAEVIVPPGLAVEASGLAIMGGFTHSTPPAVPDPNAPLLRVSGLAVMGGVDVTVRLPGETAKDAKRRVQAERRLGRGK